MKLLMLFSLLSFSVFAFAEDPSTFCDENPYCTDKMNQITSEYKLGNDQFASLPLSAFSGGCYHLSPLYESSHEHHGAFIFERSQDDLMTDGIFSFFYEQDPFDGVSALEMKAWFQSQNSTMVQTVQRNNQIELQFLGDQSDYHYWFRNNKQQTKLLVIAKQQSSGYSGLIFCEFTPKRFH